MNLAKQWEHKRLSDLAEYVNGYAFKPDDWGREGLPIIRIEQLRNPSSISDYYSGQLEERYIIQNGDLIFSWSASLFLRIWQDGEAALNQHLFRVVEKTDVDRNFLKQFIEYYLPEIKKASHGSTMQHITRRELDRFDAPFPICRQEQITIGEILGTVDRAIEQTEELIAKQRRIKNGLLHDLLTCGIDEQGNLRSEKTHDLKDSPLGRIPIEWEVKPVGAVFSVQLGKMLSKRSKLGVAPFPYLGNKNIQWERIDTSTVEWMDFTVRERGKYALSHGDILVCEGGEVGRSCVWQEDIVNCYYQKALHRLKPKEHYETELFPKFMQWAISKGVLSDFTSQTSIAHLTKEKLEALPITIQEISEQSRLCRVFKGIDVSISEEESQLEKLRLLKSGMMQDLLTGKTRVTAIIEKQRYAREQ